jgi:hypothetical protein
MRKRGLEFLAVLLTCLIVVVLFAGLDDLPRNLRKEIGAEHQALASATKQVQQAQAEVSRDLSAEPDLFRARSLATTLPERLRHAGDQVQKAQQNMAVLDRLNKANRRADREQAQKLLAEERSLRTSAETEASATLAEANRWLDFKRHLPDQMRQMQQDYQALHAFQLAAVSSAVDRAGTDWPEKKADLASRLAALGSYPAEADKTWQAIEPLRARVAANDLAGLDYDALYTGAQSIHAAALALPAKSAELQTLTGQLYDSWDKILVDLEVRRGGESRDYNEKIRTIRSHLTNVAAKQSQTTTDEKWIQVDRATYQADEKNLGMAIEHKSAGKYDSEADRVAQPAGFAYIAPPSQQSNQYGYWEHRDGGNFWVWYGQYALLRDLLFRRDYRPLSTDEYRDYRSTQSRGQTYYGRDQSEGRQKYGTSGSVTASRYKDSSYARSGGFKDSPYATLPGTYRGSRYSSPSARSSGQDSSPRRFGAKPSSPPSSGRSWSAPRSPSPRSFPSGGGGRRFGGRGRR